MDQLEKNGILWANAILLVAAFLPPNGIFIYIALFVWTISLLLLFRKTKSLLMRIFYGLLITSIIAIVILTSVIRIKNL